MDKRELLACLEDLNFTSLEAQIYFSLLEHGAQSGYQLAKTIQLSRPSIYNALEHLYGKGAVLRLPDKSSTYTAENPAVLFPKLQHVYKQTAQKAATELTQLFHTQKQERFLNFSGLDTAIFKTKELLRQAQSEVYLNADFDLHCFEQEFTQLHQKGVRVLVFSFQEMNMDGLEVEYYSHHRACAKDVSPSRLMVVVDGTQTLVADAGKERGTWLGMVTNNPLMVSLMSEHIHNDIYLIKLRDRYGSSLFDDDIRVHTVFEQSVPPKQDKASSNMNHL